MDTIRLHDLIDRQREALADEQLTQLRFLAEHDTAMCVMELIELHAEQRLDLGEDEITALRMLI